MGCWVGFNGGAFAHTKSTLDWIANHRDAGQNLPSVQREIHSRGPGQLEAEGWLRPSLWIKKRADLTGSMALPPDLALMLPAHGNLSLATKQTNSNQKRSRVHFARFAFPSLCANPTIPHSHQTIRATLLDLSLKYGTQKLSPWTPASQGCRIDVMTSNVI